MHDRLFPVILTNYGDWYYHSNNVVADVTHRHEKAESYDIEAERFDHYPHSRAGEWEPFRVQSHKQLIRLWRISPSKILLLVFSVVVIWPVFRRRHPDATGHNR